MIKFAILGAGTWGTALGNMLINMGHQVSIWSPDANEVESLNKNRVQKSHFQWPCILFLVMQFFLS